MKFQRPGYTESTLMLVDHLVREKGIVDERLEKHRAKFINFLYSTCGAYDKTVSGTYFDIDVAAVLASKTFQKWSELYRESISNCDNINILIHKMPGDYDSYKDEFFRDICNSKVSTHFWCDHKRFYGFIENKKVLIVSSFAELAQQQYESGRAKLCHPTFPNIRSLQAYTCPYTFFNKGPHQNSMETFEVVKEDISKYDFDVALISFGHYACPLVDFVHKQGKLGVSLGHTLPLMFGVDPNKKDDPNWLSVIPDKYIPEGYEKIEHGNYWRGSQKK